MSRRNETAGESSRSGRRDRGQLVLVAAAVVAVAFLSMTLAYAQLGYDADRRGAGAVDVASLSTLDGELSAAFRAAVRDVEGDYRWSERARATADVRSSLEDAADRLERAHADESRSLTVTFDEAAATEWARERCPGGDGRDFGPCRASGGVVIQERAGETTVVAAAFRIRIVSPAETTTATSVPRLT
ncbi:DUF7261 family protein [Halobellus sp. GM3]|uniref:DUF7261 family protein n=1 Tax=Halobellus sp. GM3 TaxID=3458410 RepID=UPI00403D84D9